MSVFCIFIISLALSCVVLFSSHVHGCVRGLHAVFGAACLPHGAYLRTIHGAGTDTPVCIHVSYVLR